MKEQVKSKHTLQNEEGFVLVTALLIMLVLTIIGIATTTNTSIELQIAGNDKVFKKTFYEAEAGAVLGTEILEQSFNCPTGFKSTSTLAGVDVADLTDPPTPIRIRAYDRGKNLVLYAHDLTSLNIGDIGDVTKAHIAYPIGNLDPNADGNPSDDLPETGYLYYASETQMLPGGALQMAAGYEGKGKSAAQGGVAKLIDIYSQFNGLINSEAIILFGWRHLVGPPDKSPYCN